MKRAFLLLSLAVLLGSVLAYTETLHVPQGYPTIQAAIDAAELGDTLVIASGEYREDLSIDFPLTIRGGVDVTVRGRVAVRLTAGAVHLDELRIVGTNTANGKTALDVSLGEHAQLVCERITVLDEDQCIWVSPAENHDEIMAEFSSGAPAVQRSFTLRDSILLGDALFLHLGAGTVNLENNLMIGLGSGFGVDLLSASQLKMSDSTVIGFTAGLDAYGPFHFYPEFGV